MDTHARRGRGDLRGRGGGACGLGSRAGRLDDPSGRIRARDRAGAGDDPLRRARSRTRRNDGRREQRQAFRPRTEASDPRQHRLDPAAKAARRRLHRPLAGALGRWAHHRGGLRLRGPRRAGVAADERVLWPLAFVGFLLAFLGAATLIPHHGAGSTRFRLTYEIGGIVAGVGATLSAIALVDRRLGRGAFLCALALLPIPSVAGHALDSGQWPRPLNVAADILHVGAASVWIGGLLALAVGLRRARRLAAEERGRFAAALVPRLSAVALVSVAVIAATGLVRAL